jgi:hypothetical protein
LGYFRVFPELGAREAAPLPVMPIGKLAPVTVPSAR